MFNYLKFRIMKKKVILAMGAAIVAASAVCGAYASNVFAETNALFNGNVEALTRTECLNDPENNVGSCDIKVDGTGASCVEPGWFSTIDCCGETNV